MRQNNVFSKRAIMLISLLVIWLASIPALSAVSVLINYQGKLTDVGGNPVADGDYDVIFTIYSGFGPGEWSSGPQPIAVNDGLFNYILGSSVPLPDSIFKNSSLYLGIKIGDDPEITPRTPLTSTPYAAIANRLNGDIETGEGFLALKNSEGESIITMEVNSEKIVGGSIYMFNPQPEPPAAGLELLVRSGIGSRMTFFDAESFNGRELLTVDASPTTGGSIRGFNPQPEPPAMIAFEMSINFAKESPGGLLGVYGTDGSSTKLTGGDIQLGRTDAASTPTGSFLLNGGNCELTLTGQSAAAPPSTIFMQARGDSAKVGIGTATPSEALHVVGNIALTGEVIIVTDTKLKTDIEDIDDALYKVSQLRGVTYGWKRDEYPDYKLGDRRQVGLLAQDVEKVLPEVVHEDDRGTKYVAYSKLTALLVEAIKELKTENEQLAQRIEALESR